MEKKMKTYYAWKTDSNLTPIEGTDRILEAVSQREAIKFLAYENGVKIREGALTFSLPNGDRWFVRM